MANREGMVRKTDATERLTHWILAGSFLFALFTGLGMMFHHWSIIPTILGGYYAVKWMHIFSGVVFGISLIAVIIMWWVDAGKFVEGDGKWILQAGGYLWDVKDMPPSGKFNAGQKIFFWFVVVFGILLVITGLIMISVLSFPVVVARWAYMLHAMSVFVLASFLMVHIYLGTIGNPGTLQAMLYGWVSREWAQFHCPRWLEEHDRKGQAAQEAIEE